MFPAREAPALMRNTFIDRVMTSEPVTVGPADSVASARHKLEAGGIHHLPVVDEGKLVGMVSTADLLKLYLLDNVRDAEGEMTVDQIMADDPMTLEVGSTLRDAAEMLSAGAFHALPVVDVRGYLAGIVTSTDMVAYLLRQIPIGDGTLSEPFDGDALRRLHALEKVYEAAEGYIHSGMAAREHTVLMRRLEEARGSSPEVNL